MKVAEYTDVLYTESTLINKLRGYDAEFWIEYSKADNPKADRKKFVSNKDNDFYENMAKTTAEHVINVIKDLFANGQDGDFISFAKTGKDGFVGSFLDEEITPLFYDVTIREVF